MVKYLSIDKDHIENEIGYLTRSVINQSINLKKKKKTISTDSLWLPEPVSTDNADQNINKEEILSYSILVLLEKLSAKERAVFILKEAFDYSHREIAETIGFTLENSRKLISRAKTKLANYRNTKNKSPDKDDSHLKNYIQEISHLLAFLKLPLIQKILKLIEISFYFSLLTKTSLGFDPLNFPTTPVFSNWSIILPARA